MTMLLPKKILALLFWLSAMTLGSAQGVIRFANLGPSVDAPFFASNGTNLLAGSNYVAGLYIAPTNGNAFSLVGPIQQFRVGIDAGRWFPVNITLVGIPGGTTLRVQVRFWDQSRPNVTFDQAEAAGAEIGVAEIPALTLEPAGTPTPLFGLQSASLIPTLTLSRGNPLTVYDPATTTSGSQLVELCSIPVGINRWFRLVSPRPAVAVLNTDGSLIDTVLAAFTGSIVNLAGLTQLACNDNRAPDLTSSAFNLPVQADVLYLLCVAGKNGASGPVQLNYAAGISLEIRRIPLFNIIEVSWPADAGNYQLESSAHFQPGASWQPVLDPPLLIDGRFIVPVPASDRHQSFRLRANTP